MSSSRRCRRESALSAGRLQPRLPRAGAPGRVPPGLDGHPHPGGHAGGRRALLLERRVGRLRGEHHRPAPTSITRQAETTVDFPATIMAAYDDGVRVFVEHGPAGACTNFIREILDDRDILAVHLDRRNHNIEQLFEVCAALVAAGVDVDHRALTDRLSRRTADADDPRRPGDVVRGPPPTTGVPDATIGRPLSSWRRRRTSRRCSTWRPRRSRRPRRLRRPGLAAAAERGAVGRTPDRAGRRRDVGPARADHADQRRAPGVRRSPDRDARTLPRRPQRLTAPAGAGSPRTATRADDVAVTGTDAAATSSGVSGAHRDRVSTAGPPERHRSAWTALGQGPAGDPFVGSYLGTVRSDVRTPGRVRHPVSDAGAAAAAGRPGDGPRGRARCARHGHDLDRDRRRPGRVVPQRRIHAGRLHDRVRPGRPDADQLHGHRPAQPRGSGRTACSAAR